MRILPRSLMLLLCGLWLLAGCQSSSVQAPAPLPLPDLTVGVAPFTQPVQSTQLLAGYVPEQQGHVPAEELQKLDELLADKLAATGRRYTFLPPSAADGPLQQDGQGRRSALATWMQQAREAGVDILLVPQIIDWRERVGGTAGVVTPAAVTADFFLIDAREPGALLQRSHYAVEQQALSNNLLSMGAFLKRKGKWITAEELTGEAMAKAIKEFGL